MRKTPLSLLSLIFTMVFVISPSVVLADKGQGEPKVPFKYALGKNKFQEKCAECHGDWGGGTDMGPPLIHPFYKPSHHGDSAFYRAALNGVRAHHWNFGDMPPVSGATKEDLDAIVPFVRWLQQEKGLY